jgi:hypothetical protein
VTAHQDKLAKLSSKSDGVGISQAAQALASVKTELEKMVQSWESTSGELEEKEKGFNERIAVYEK